VLVIETDFWTIITDATSTGPKQGFLCHGGQVLRLEYKVDRRLKTKDFSQELIDTWLILLNNLLAAQSVDGQN
jgi:hypothetical protein